MAKFSRVLHYPFREDCIVTFRKLNILDYDAFRRMGFSSGEKTPDPVAMASFVEERIIEVVGVEDDSRALVWPNDRDAILECLRSDVEPYSKFLSFFASGGKSAEDPQKGN